MTAIARRGWLTATALPLRNCPKSHRSCATGLSFRPCKRVLERLVAIPALGSDNRADAREVEMRSGDEAIGLRYTLHQPLAGRTRRGLICIVLPRQLGSGKLDRWHVHDVAPDEQGLAGIRHFKRGMADLVA